MIACGLTLRALNFYIGLFVSSCYILGFAFYLKCILLNERIRENFWCLGGYLDTLHIIVHIVVAVLLSVAAQNEDKCLLIPWIILYACYFVYFLMSLAITCTEYLFGEVREVCSSHDGFTIVILSSVLTFFALLDGMAIEYFFQLSNKPHQLVHGINHISLFME